eukprot:CAMPEP_0173466556 /NCGR_PEP_ID=MMETSP1357-20121228/73526_1 /TAXON_ID=77926 /ORGANISM="Hemiselmis rufescens, Strain PCC563" /LENGTH=89 /DNA_ID=CAMNT_0014434623 /DNA_START=335 /DNA_END=601 /DNA_ORIENTATION=-
MAAAEEAAASGVAALGLSDPGGLIAEHTFQEVVVDVRVCFQVVMMKDSCMVWVGTAQASMGHLDMAMTTHMDSVPSHTTLLGDGGDGVG